MCLPWLEERRRWSSRRNGDLLSSYGQTKPPFSVPKRYPCPCTASQLELGKLRVAGRARKGFGQLLTPLGQTEEHNCVCCSLRRVEVGAPALLGWRWTLLPAWVTKEVSEGTRDGEPQLAHGGGSRSPRRSLCGQSCSLPAPSDPAWGDHSAHGRPQCPSVCPSGTAARQGRLVGCYGGCVCVCCSFDDHEKNFTLHSNEHPWVCYSTSEHRKTQ